MYLFRYIWSIAPVFLIIAALSIGSEVNAQETEATVEEQVAAEMPVLKGDIWVTMTPASKLAFVWGAGHVVTIEQVLMRQYPELKRESFVLKVAESQAASPMKMQEVVATVDNFYTQNPDKLETPVMHVIWDTMIVPNIQTGIGGQPVN